MPEYPRFGDQMPTFNPEVLYWRGGADNLHTDTGIIAQYRRTAGRAVGREMRHTSPDANPGTGDVVG